MTKRQRTHALLMGYLAYFADSWSRSWRLRYMESWAWSDGDSVSGSLGDTAGGDGTFISDSWNARALASKRQRR